MSVAEFEILHDKTIELLDGNNENILLRILQIGYQNDTYYTLYMLFDSKERIYTTHANIDISSFYYSSDLKLRYNYNGCIDWHTYQLTDNTHDNIVIHYGFIKSKIIQYFYDNRNEYWPTFGLTNFELK